MTNCVSPDITKKIRCFSHHQQRENHHAPQQGLDIKLPDPVQVAKTIATIAEKSQRLVNDFLRRQAAEGWLDMESSLRINKAFLELTHKMMLEPAKLAQAQMSLWQDYRELWRRSAAAFFGQQVEPVVTPEASDKRFQHAAWQDNYLFDFIKQAYLLTARWLQNVVSRMQAASCCPDRSTWR